MLVQCSQPYRIISDGNKTRLIIPGCNKPFAKEVGFGHKLRGLQINAWRNMDNENDLEYDAHLLGKTHQHFVVFQS